MAHKRQRNILSDIQDYASMIFSAPLMFGAATSAVVALSMPVALLCGAGGGICALNICRAARAQGIKKFSTFYRLRHSRVLQIAKQARK